MAEQGSLRTVVIGIDAGCRSVLEPQFDAGELPTLNRLFSTCSGALESQIPPWTASAWPTLYTGVNPGKHGVYDFLSFDGYDWSVVNATHIRRRTLWEYLDFHGYRSVVVNVPVTHPPRPFDGALVPGYTAPESPTCHPEGLLDELEAAIGEYTVYGTVEQATDCIRQRGDAFRYLVDRFDPEFGFVQFQWTDAICHKRPGDWDELRRVYRAVDEQIGSILSDCAPQNVLVVSDHGIGPYDGRSFLVNDYLKNDGYVTATNGGSGMPSWAGVRERQLKRGGAGDTPNQHPIQSLLTGAARLGLTSQRIESILSTVGLRSVVANRVPSTLISSAAEQVDFERSTAYMRSRTEMGVRINLAGREPNGTVAQQAYEDVRKELISTLRGVKTPAGDPVFETVAPREQFFHGPHIDRGPDIVTVPSNFDQFLSTRIGTEQFSQPDEPWNHKRFGVIAAEGAAIDASASLAGAHLFDVAPTVLATLGVPASAEMDGDVLEIASSCGEQEYPTFEPSSRTTTTDQAIEDQLADLGYIE